jgi:hypothetical protein
VLATPEDDTFAALKEADLQNAEADYEAAVNKVESVENLLADALKEASNDGSVTVEDVETSDDLEALLLGANVDPDQIAYLVEEYNAATEYMATADEAVIDAQAAYAAAITPPKAANTTVIVVIVVALLLIGAVIGFAYHMKSNQNSGSAAAGNFDNPMYDAVHGSQGNNAGEKTFMDNSQQQQQQQQSSGYMDVNAGQQSAGYMDVTAGQQSAGYMDVTAQGAAAAPEDNFDDGFSDDEEV